MRGSMNITQREKTQMRMNKMRRLAVALFLAACVSVFVGTGAAQKQAPAFAPDIHKVWPNVWPKIWPKVWDDREMADLELPLADPAASPKQVSADYYYRIPVRPIYKSY